MNENKRNDILKLIAVAAMTIDHTGALFFPNQVLFRIIGRIAFPIFAYHIALGFKHTSNIKRYLVRLGGFAVLSIVPFYLFSMAIYGNPRYQNVIFTFFFSLFFLYLIDNKKYLISLTSVVIPLIVLEYLGFTFDYGLYGIGMVLVFYLFSSPVCQSTLILILTLAYQMIRLHINGYNVLYAFTSIQIFSVLAVFLIHSKIKISIKLPKGFFYVYYPVHMMLLILIYNMMF
ncbi:TraX family protein [Alkalibacter mobilis]|uniref:TraX family protein n=1 Tax=Alkalibacter mobilis TaxID=2787712 RepID=UPI00189F55AE|nr:TraX family protein [Alkalibacter mobilis]MBF7096865.1 conjugal transfer protein TraX [Alkalibacter mobilis]